MRKASFKDWKDEARVEPHSNAETQDKKTIKERSHKRQTSSTQNV